MSTIDMEGAAEEYLKIDKISDDVYALAPTVILRFNVSLSKISGGKRYHYHKEFEYPSKSIHQPLVTVKRSFDYYLSFESPQKDNNTGTKLFIRIGAQEYFLLKKCLNEVESWFTDEKFSNLYVTIKGKLTITTPYPHTRIHSLPMGKYIDFKPTIIDRGIANADKEPGIRIEFGDPNCVVSITLDKFMGLKYTIDYFNMYQSAAILINYNARPPYGTNRVNMGTEHTLPGTDYNVMTGTDGIQDRHVTPKGSKNNISSLEG